LKVTADATDSAFFILQSRVVDKDFLHKVILSFFIDFFFLTETVLTAIVTIVIQLFKIMQQTINMLDFRKSPGEVINEVFYNKKKIIIKRNKRKMAVIIPYMLYEKLFMNK